MSAGDRIPIPVAFDTRPTAEQMLCLATMAEYFDHINLCADCKTTLWCEHKQHLFNAAFRAFTDLQPDQSVSGSALTEDEEKER